MYFLNEIISGPTRSNVLFLNLLSIIDWKINFVTSPTQIGCIRYFPEPGITILFFIIDFFRYFVKRSSLPTIYDGRKIV